jgi:hypothetical protein
MSAMRASTSLLLPIFLVACFHSATAQTEIADPGAKQICASVKDVELPAADRPTPAEEKALATCMSVDAYFGFGQPDDPVKARKCAYAEIDRGAKSTLGGKAILMMVYANGKGVARNYDAALKLACNLGGAPGDDAGRVYQIDRLKKANWAGNNFSVCDHSSGREMYEQCAILTERFDKIERDQKLNDLISSWSAPQKKAFHAFLEEADEFFKVQASNGVNLEGSFEIQEEIFLKKGLLSALEQFERGELPKFSHDDFLQAEAAQQTAYLSSQNGKVTRWGTITSESVKRSENAWLRYRSAWIKFGGQKYPSVSVESWKAWLDQDRVVTLSRFLH